MKSLLQFATTTDELNSLAGRRIDSEFLIPDMILGIAKSFQINPKKTMQEISSAVQHVILRDGRKAGRTLGQFLPKEVRHYLMKKYTLGWLSPFKPAG